MAVQYSGGILILQVILQFVAVYSECNGDADCDDKDNGHDDDGDRVKMIMMTMTITMTMMMMMYDVFNNEVVTHRCFG